MFWTETIPALSRAATAGSVGRSLVHSESISSTRALCSTRQSIRPIWIVCEVLALDQCAEARHIASWPIPITTQPSSVG